MGKSRFALIVCILVGHGFFVSGVEASVETSRCEAIFSSVSSARPDPKEVRRAAYKVIPKFTAYFHSIGERVLERAGLLDLASVALLAEEHMLLMGPPGNAKSQLSDLVLGNLSEADGAKSYFRIQMTPETTMSETHGPMDYKKLSDTGEYDRLHHQGMGAKRNVFIDEIFDARANAQRNILGLLAERSHAQGSHVIKAEIETVIGATNRYLSEVYDKAGDDGPKAVLDRFALVAFVPATFEETSSYVQIIRRSKQPMDPIPELKFDDVEALRALLPQVEISVPVAKALSLLSSRMKAETEALETASLKSAADKIKNGEEPGVPYRATKYHSPRTIGKASAILRAFVVRDWIGKNGKRKLEATIQDLAQLEKFFTLNGPAEDFVRFEMSRTSNKHERAQLMAILQEREIFERHFNKIVQEMDEVAVKYALSEMAGVVGMAKTTDEKRAATESVIAVIAKVSSDRVATGFHRDLTGEEIGRDFVQRYLESLLRGLLPARDFEVIQKSIASEVERQRREMIELAQAAHRAEQARLLAAEREEARREAAAKAAADEAARRTAALRDQYSDPEKFKRAIDANGANGVDARSGTILVAYDQDSEKFAVYNRDSDELRVYSTKKMPTNGEISSKVIQGLLGEEISGNDEIGEIYFADSENINFYNTSGTAMYSYNLKRKTAETTAVSVKTAATTYDRIGARTLSFDPSTLKLKSFSKTGTSAVAQFKFVGSAASTKQWDESTFKATMSHLGLTLQVSKDGKYAVLQSLDRTGVFKLDFVKKEVSPVVFDELEHGDHLEVSSSSILGYRDYEDRTEFLALDVSGEEPIVKKLKMMGEDPESSNSVVSLVEGSNLLLVSAQASDGFILVDGLDGSSIGSAFGLDHHNVQALYSFGAAHIALSYHQGTWSTVILKQKQRAE